MKTNECMNLCYLFFVCFQAAEDSRERKKKISSNADSLRFEKTIELAQRQLKETNNIANAELRQEAVRQQMYNNNNGNNNPLPEQQVTIPLTDTTKRLSLVSQTLTDDNTIKKDCPKSPKKVVPLPQKLAQSPTKTPPVPPTKPPRTYDHDSPTHPDLDTVLQEQHGDIVNSNIPGDIMIVKSPVVIEQVAPAVNVTIAQSSNSNSGSVVAAPIPGPCLSTFTAGSSSSASSTNSDPPTPTKTAAKPPSSLAASSTPKSTASHSVTFASTVTEIPDPMSPASNCSDSSGSSASSGSKKKVPPPPPPRKSSRLPTSTSTTSAASSTTTTTQSTAGAGASAGAPPRPPSPPAYENLDTLKQKVQSKSEQQESSPSPKGFRPLSKYQKELASGIYSNMNRPDLQDQKVQADKIVRSPEHTAKHRPPLDSVTRDGSDTDSAPELEQLSATVRRRITPNGSKENSPSPQANPSSSTNSTTASILKDQKKVPPPPPVRKTSALTSENNGNNGVKVVGNGDATAVKVGNGDVVSNIGNGSVSSASPNSNKLSTGKQQQKRMIDTRSLSPASLRKYEETEIY